MGLWRRPVTYRLVYTDCHTHVLPPKRLGKLMKWIHRSYPGQGVPADITSEEAVAELRRNGAVRWANLLFPIWSNEAPSLHAWGAEMAERYPEMTPFGGVLADDPDPLGIVQEAVERHGMAGLKFHPFVQRTMPWDPRLRPVLDYLERGGRPVYVHTGYEQWYGQDFDYPALEEMIADRPRLPVVLPHIGYPDFEWAYRMAERHENVWLDVTNVAGSIILIDPDDDEHRRLADLFRHGVSRLAGRIMFGTDHPAGMGPVEVIFEGLDRFDIPESDREALVMTTAASFFDRYGRPRP